MKHLIIFISIFLLFLGCNSIKYFNIFRQQIVNGEVKSPIKTDGIYYGTNSNGAFYLFHSGLKKAPNSLPKNGEFWSNPKLYLDTMEYYSKKLWGWDSELWGHYKIINDSIYIQTFIRLFQANFKRYIVESVGTITNDSTFQIHYDVSYWPLKYQKEHKLKTVFYPPETFKFYPTIIKPDSTQAWFFNKKWYKEGLHPNRK